MPQELEEESEEVPQELEEESEEVPQELEEESEELKEDFSAIALALVRKDNKLYRIRPESLEKYRKKASFITQTGAFALVDLDKNKVRPFLMSMLGQYEMLPELALLRKIWYSVLGILAFCFVLLIKPGDSSEIKKSEDRIINAISGSTIITTKTPLNPFTQERKVLEPKEKENVKLNP